MSVVCTAGEVGGWSHSVMISHYDKTITLGISRHDEYKPMECHKMDGKVWKYRTFEEQELIEDKCREIGLAVGSLRRYEDV